MTWAIISIVTILFIALYVWKLRKEINRRDYD